MRKCFKYLPPSTSFWSRKVAASPEIAMIVIIDNITNMNDDDVMVLPLENEEEY